VNLKSIKLEHITKDIKANVILDDISFELGAGEICAVIGKNGAGKSTLFKIMTGQITPTKGEFSYIYHGKQTIPSIGSLIERPLFFNNLSAFENLKYFSIQKGQCTTEEIKEVIRIVGLLDNKKSYSNFSLGMKQRLGLALALIFKPDILILDEPVNGLDPEGIRDIRKILLKFNRELGTTILISSHILTELEEISNSYIFIDKGRLIEKVTKKELQGKLKSYLRFIVDNVQKAIQVLDEQFPDLTYFIENGNEIKISGDSENLGLINRKFVNQNITVLGIETQKLTLEDYFFEVISRSEKHEQLY
jgi:ABC-2 type transport system ATP-binding protein